MERCFGVREIQSKCQEGTLDQAISQDKKFKIRNEDAGKQGGGTV